ncbi:hypothetical protein L208DRAFT_1412147 [Tricholoma matsutake]|nr:hypothetical protein L208DRAFT_1412146 [Tricholoma matsutake 945]KAF8223242.1 hypothetical protein L208DRAFT_1412147 [Tricholoma matsutake 945]
MSNERKASTKESMTNDDLSRMRRRLSQLPVGEIFNVIYESRYGGRAGSWYDAKRL